MPCLRLSRGDPISTSRPCIRMVPASLAWTPAMILISVDLPAPFSPHEGVHLAGSQRQVDIFERHDARKPLADADHFERPDIDGRFADEGPMQISGHWLCSARHRDRSPK